MLYFSILLLSFVTTFFVQFSFSLHHCMHGELEYNLTQTSVEYVNHPYSSENILLNNERRQLASIDLTAYNYSSIRITPYYDPETINTSVLNATEISTLKELLSSAIAFVTNFVSVIPIDSPFNVPRQCSSWYVITDSYTDETYNNCIQYRSTCLETTIPASHLDSADLYPYPGYGSSNITRLEKGAGINNSDLVLYVSYGTSACGTNTLAYATPCSQDQYGRPVAAGIHLCPRLIENDDWKENVVVMLHEITHGMVFSTSLWSSFIEPTTGETLPFSDVIFDKYGNGSRYWVISPKVKELAQEYFDCDSLIGLPLEDDGISGSAHVHWEEHHLNREYMQSTIYSSMQFITSFTMAFMEDSGWYNIDYNYSEPFFFGKSEGCNWFTNDCINKTSHVSNYEQYFCDAAADDGCSNEYTSIATCSYYYYGTDVEYQWFTDASHGGPENSEYCPFRVPYSVENFVGICWNEDGNTLDWGYTGSVHGLTSRCVDTSSTDDSAESDGLCFAHTCVDYDEITKAWASVIITMSANENITCTAAEEKFTIKYSSTTELYVKCPDVSVICRNEQPFACYFGNWNNDYNECVCSPGYTGDVCNEESIALVDEVEEFATTPAPTAENNNICVDGSDYDFTGYYNYYAYYSITGSTFVYWNVWYHQWYITSELGSTFVSALCAVGVAGTDIEECNGYWYVVSNGEFVLDPDYTSNYGLCSPTVLPTRSPTPAPSESPTVHPTGSPTPAPSESPTVHPTGSPTPAPIESPSVHPTGSPNMSPNVLQTGKPTVWASKSNSKDKKNKTKSKRKDKKNKSKRNNKR